jgi:hypothetical protein
VLVHWTFSIAPSKNFRTKISKPTEAREEKEREREVVRYVRPSEGYNSSV